MTAHAAADLIDYARRLLEAAGLDAMIAVDVAEILVEGTCSATTPMTSRCPPAT